MKSSDYGNLSQKYANEVSIECIQRNIPIGEVEKSVGLSLGYISRCRKGTKYISVDAVEEISNFLGVDFVERVRGKENIYE